MPEVSLSGGAKVHGGPNYGKTVAAIDENEVIIQ